VIDTQRDTQSDAGGRTARIEAAVATAAAADLRLVRFIYADYNGIVRGRAVHAAGLSDRLYEGIALPFTQVATDGRGRPAPGAGLTAVGELRLMADPSTLVTLPFAPRTGAMLGDLLTLDRETWPGCPRGFLRRMLEEAGREGLMVEAVFEPEFYLVRSDGQGGWLPADRAVGWSTAGMQAAAELLDDLVAALDGQAIRVEQIGPESGDGQHGLTIGHGPALRAADQHLLVRETVRAVAERHGLAATFAARPFADQPGSGAHVHLSLWDTRTGENRFHDARRPGGFSAAGGQFVAGVLEHLPGLVALTCPSVNSGRRLEPGAQAGAFAAWGFDHREVAARIPSPMWGREQGTTNVEVRAVDGTCNPYLALGAILAAGLDGLRRGLDPGPPLADDPTARPAAEPTDRGVDRLPTTPESALQALAADRVLTDALGDVLTAAVVAVRRAEAERFAGRTEADEYAEHILRY
jgi:glutamine synthetase